MKTLMRYFTAAAALGVLLVLSGCFTTNAARNGPGRPIPQFTVVESSPGLEMTPQLLADLRESVTAYLKQEGLTRDGEYVVKVNLMPDQPEDTGQWVVLRISTKPTRTYTLLAAYPGSDDYYPYDFHGYDYYGLPGYYRYGYYNPLDFGYDYYYGGSYFPPVPGTPRAHPPRDRDNRPPATHTRWDTNRPDPGRPRTDTNQPRPNHPRGGDRDQPRDHNPGSPRGRHGDGGGSYSPPPVHNSPPPSYTPPAPREQRDANSSSLEPMVAR